MDRASQVLAQSVPPGVPRSYRALADHGNVPEMRTVVPEIEDFKSMFVFESKFHSLAIHVPYSF